MEIVFVNGNQYYEIWSNHPHVVELAVNLLFEHLSERDKDDGIDIQQFGKYFSTRHKLDKNFSEEFAVDILKSFVESVIIAGKTVEAHEILGKISKNENLI